jgi:hypothetical protein
MRYFTMIELPKMEWGEFIIVFFAPMADPKGFQRLLLEGFLDTDNTDLPCGHNVTELHGKTSKRPVLVRVFREIRVQR